jgi:hypothetical protein
MPSASNNFLAAKGIFLTCVLLALSACGAGNGEGLDRNGQPVSGGPPVGQPPPTEPPGEEPPPAETPVSDFQEIQDTVFTPICTQCHVGANAPQGMRLDAANSYAMIVNVASNEVPGLKRIDPGNPDQSYLVQKISGTAAVGGRMPLGQAPLPQDRIDLIRRWVAAGAPPASVAPDHLTVNSVIPAPGEVAAAGLSKLTVVFARDVDATLAASGTFEVRDGFDQLVPVAAAQVPQGRPNVVELTLAQALPAGSYQLRVRGQGPVALADNAGHVLDGDADGKAGGDFLMSFDVSAGASR